jgi:hypothetical protein
MRRAGRQRAFRGSALDPFDLSRPHGEKLHGINARVGHSGAPPATTIQTRLNPAAINPSTFRSLQLCTVSAQSRGLEKKRPREGEIGPWAARRSPEPSAEMPANPAELCVLRQRVERQNTTLAGGGKDSGFGNSLRAFSPGYAWANQLISLVDRSRAPCTEALRNAAKSCVNRRDGFRVRKFSARRFARLRLRQPADFVSEAQPSALEWQITRNSGQTRPSSISLPRRPLDDCTQRAWKNNSDPVSPLKF